MQARRRWIAGAFVSWLFAASLHALVFAAGDQDGASWTVPARAARQKNPVVRDARSITDGKSIYIEQCLQCHGSNGKGDGSCGNDLDPRPSDLSGLTAAAQTDGALYWKITNGHADMPAFDKLLSDRERWNVVVYIRSLQPSSATRPAS
jgi:mono/diheme cytochrome c family protein